MTNRPLRKALLEKLDVSPQRLSQRVKKLKKQCAMTTEDATYVIAHQVGIPLDKYLDKETIDRVRNLQSTLSPTIVSSPVGKATGKRRTGTEDKQRVVIIGGEFKLTDPILQQRKLLEARDMAAIYPFLYVLENSIREVIERVMTRRYGDKWWDSKAGDLKKAVNKRTSDEERNMWHQRRGARPIDYLDFAKLPILVEQVEKDFVPDIIPSIGWFKHFVDEVYKSRCVVCHMNPLDNTNIQSVKVKFTQWQRQVEGKKDLIPEA